MVCNACTVWYLKQIVCNAYNMLDYVKWYMCKDQCRAWNDTIEAIQGSEEIQAYVLFICFELVKQTKCWVESSLLWYNRTKWFALPLPRLHFFTSCYCPHCLFSSFTHSLQVTIHLLANTEYWHLSLLVQLWRREYDMGHQGLAHCQIVAIAIVLALWKYFKSVKVLCSFE